MTPFFDKIARQFRWKKSSDDASSAKSPQSRRLHIEPLEDRTLLAACYVNANVTGTGGDGTSWGSACKTLQAALDFAADSSRSITEIWVAEGTYTPSKPTTTTEQRSATFSLVNGVSIYGGFAGTESSKDARQTTDNGKTYVKKTILSGDLGLNDDLGNSDTVRDNAYTVLYGSGLSSAITIDGVTISGGNANPYSGQTTGTNAHWYNGGGVTLLNCTNVTLDKVVVTENSAINGGGGIYIVGGATTIKGSTISENFANVSGGGVSFGSGTLTVQTTVFADNATGNTGGGGLYQGGGTLNVSTSHFSGNTGIYGGGLLQADGTGTITSSSFVSNIAPDRFSIQGQGGGICQFGVMSLSTTTFANNVAGTGGGIFFSNNADNQSPKAESTYSNLTISGNVARTTGGGIYIVSGLMSLNTSIVAANSAATSPDIYGELSSGKPKTTLVLSGSNNVIGNGTGIPAVPDGSGKTTIANGLQGNQVGTATTPLDPKAGAPTDSGNGVFVLPLLEGSPALGKGMKIGVVDTATAARAARTYIVDSLDDVIAVDGKTTFREAFEAANRNIQVGDAPAGSFTETDIITFKDGLTGTIYLNGKAITIYSGLTISGWTSTIDNVSSPGAMNYLTLDAGYKSSVIKAVGKIDVNISEITLQHGRSSVNGGGVVAYSSNITLNKVAIRDSIANGLEGGGGFYSKSATLNATDIIVADCSATVSGGGMLLNTTNASIVGASIYRNQAANEGGGIYMTSTNGTSVISNATFAQNRASLGAGLALLETTVRLIHLTVTKNVGDYIGGIMIGANAKVEMNNSIVADNFSYISPDIEVYKNGDTTSLLQGSNNLVGNNTGLSGLTTANQNKIGTAASPIDPKFSGPTYYNGQLVYPLASSSPAVDAGNNDLSKGKGSTTLQYDVRGSAYPRFVSKTSDGKVDMGACEYQATLVGSIQSTSTTIRLGQDLEFKGQVVTGSTTGQKYLWDFNNNGIFGEIGDWATQGVEYGEIVKFISEGIIPEPGLYPIRFIVENSSGKRSDPYELGINILTEAPTYTVYGAMSFNAREGQGWDIEAMNTQNDPIMKWTVSWGDKMETVINGGPGNRISVRHLYAAPGVYEMYVETVSYFGDKRLFKLADLQVLAHPSTDIAESVNRSILCDTLESVAEQIQETTLQSAAVETSGSSAVQRFWEDPAADVLDTAIELESTADIATLALYERAADKVLADWTKIDDFTADSRESLFDF